MDILKSGDNYYVKFEMFFEQESSSCLIVRFTSYISLTLDEFDVWDSEEPDEFKRSPNETALLRVMLDALLVDRNIGSPSGRLLDSIGGGSTHLALCFNEIRAENTETRNTEIREELERRITKVVNEFLSDKGVVPA